MILNRASKNETSTFEMIRRRAIRMDSGFNCPKILRNHQKSETLQQVKRSNMGSQHHKGHLFPIGAICFAWVSPRLLARELTMVFLQKCVLSIRGP